MRGPGKQVYEADAAATKHSALPFLNRAYDSVPARIILRSKGKLNDFGTRYNPLGYN